MHHVTTRGNNRRVLFGDDADRMTFLRLLGRTTMRVEWRCLSYCLMDNHIHLLIETGDEPALSRAMQWLLGRYAQMLNTRHNTTGHVYEGRFGARPVRDEAHLLATIAYIARNPVDAGCCAAAGDYPWSSHRAVAHGLDTPLVATRRLLEILGGWGGDPLEHYLRLSGDVRRHLPEPITVSIVPLSSILAATGGWRDAVLHHGYSVREVAAATGRSPATISRQIRAVKRV